MSTSRPYAAAFSSHICEATLSTDVPASMRALSCASVYVVCVGSSTYLRSWAISPAVATDTPSYAEGDARQRTGGILFTGRLPVRVG